jgi:hypothetical protein
MNLDQLQSKLIAAARNARPDERVPYAFEKRIMARLAAMPAVDWLGAWGAALWRAALGCVVVAVVSGAVVLTQQSSGENDLSQDFETALYASAEAGPEAW